MLDLDPHNPAETMEIRVLSWRAVWKMPEHLRRVITHLYICDRSIEEAAQLLGVSQKTVVAIHEKAVEYLRGRTQAWQ